MKLKGKELLLVVASLLVAVLVLEAGLRLAGWATFRSQARHAPRAEQAADFVAIAIGESTTQGVGGADPERNYPNILARLLREKCPGRSIRVENLGVAGMSSWDIASALPGNLEKFKPDAVITMVGINDPTMSGEDRERSQIEALAMPESSREVVRPASFRVVRLYRWVRESLAALFSKNLRALTVSFERVPEEILRKIQTGDDIVDGQKFAIHFSQPLQNISIEFSIKMHEKFVAAHPDHAWALLELGNLLRERDTKRAIQLHKLALERLRNKDERPWFLYMMATDYATAGDWKSFRQVERELMRKANAHTVMRLLDLYLRYGQEAKAIRVLEEYLQTEPNEPVTLGTRKMLLMQKGRAMRRRGPNPEELPIFEHLTFTRNNYIRILSRSRNAGAEVFVMQYPTRSARLLESMLQGAPAGGWRLISHEENFKQALRKYGYHKLFTDYLGGTFGHMTKLGNTVLAENAADFLLTHAAKLRAICKDGDN